NGAALLEHRLVQVRLLELIGLVGVAGQASAGRVGLQESRSAPGVRIVTGEALSLCARMRHPGFFDFLGLISVAGDAQRLAVRVRQDNFSVFRWRVAD